MDVEIIFTGLCTFLNLEDDHDDLPEPSVILVRAEGHGDHHDSGVDDRHVPFIAFDSREVLVTGAADLRKVPGAPPFRMIVLDGEEIAIEKCEPPGKLDVGPSYATVVKRDDYWPQAIGSYDRDVVPQKGAAHKPLAARVAAFMRFGDGRITADNLTTHEWEFAIPELNRPAGAPAVHRDRFAQEVIYSEFPHSGDEIVMTLTKLDKPSVSRTFRFSRAPQNKQQLTLVIGNLVEDDLQQAVNGGVMANPRVGGRHFELLNRTAGLKDPGPIPVAVTTRTVRRGGPGGGGSGGLCGPNNGNGRKATTTGGGS